MPKLITHGIRNVKVAIEAAGVWGTLLPVLYAKTLSLPVKNNDLDIYADDTLQLKLPSDQGYEGNINFSTRDDNLEKQLGYLTGKVDGGGLADIKVYGYKNAAIYYETQTADKDGTTYTSKNWLLSCTIGKPQISSTGDTDSISVEDVQYPLSVRGVAQLKATGTDILKDENGNEVYIRKLTKFPSDDGYETFENAVPVPKAAT